ncbi:uncharacterized protein EV154DRAFT_316283 [Mucor mucedo]|uniref:uncharacterized protein n=1 Tax=Mucor mucedo TaxID=29922 RepID=UPI002220B6DB|nr:uncharacterized protein EV154DRAFT_316283 [Mucor mucedo]KAI7895658.1 hypothetical protein EV154DRAFT_316283 [Mucor mucedo]
MKQIQDIQLQISTMENELCTLKIARDKNVEEIQTSRETNSLSPDTRSMSVYSQDSDSVYQIKTEKDESYYDYPSPVSMNNTLEYIPAQSNHYDSQHKQKQHRHHHYHQDRAFKKESHQELFAPLDQKQTIAKCKAIEATITKKSSQQPWTLTVQNGNMSIETHISSYAELMSHFEGMATTCLYQTSTSKLPFPILKEPCTPRDALGAALGMITWRKYGKSRFKSLAGYTPTLLHYDGATGVTVIAPATSMETITMRLVYTYINCLHVQKFYIHVPSFIRLFMTERSVIQSPAVMALCSIICQQNCKHISAIIPEEALSDYGAYYFEQARELIADQFDEANLETLFTFTFLAVSKILIKDDKQADRYLCIAERIYNVLLPQYKSRDGSCSDESVLFARIYRCLHHSRSAILIHEIMETENPSRSVIPRIAHLMEDLDDAYIQPAQDDSPREKQYIQVRRHINQLRESIRMTIGNISAPDFMTFIGTFGHQVEMVMRHWYRHVLPVDFQLQIPLFEGTWTDIEFFTHLELECGDSPIPVMVTLILYNEYLIMSKSYVPKRPGDTPLDTTELLEKFKHVQKHACHHEENEHNKMHHWVKIIQKMAHIKRGGGSSKDLTMNDEEILEFIKVLNISQIGFNIPFLHTAVVVALDMVRLFQFLLSRDYSCFLDLRWVMNTWQLLMRAAKYKYQQPGDEEVTLDRIRANLILCLNIMRDQLKSSRRDSSGSFVEMMEQEFKSLF